MFKVHLIGPPSPGIQPVSATPTPPAAVPATRAETTSAFQNIGHSQTIPGTAGNRWATPPRTASAGFKFAVERGTLPDQFQREFFALIRNFFPTLGEWRNYFSAKYPQGKTELPQNPWDYLGAVKKAISILLRDGGLEDFWKALADPLSDQGGVVIAFSKRWSRRLPVLIAIEKLEKGPQEWAQRLLADMDPQDRLLFDGLRCNGPQDVKSIQVFSPENHRSLREFLEVRIGVRLDGQPCVPWLAPGILARLDALSLPDRELLRSLLEEADRPIFDALFTPKRWWSGKKLSGFFLSPGIRDYESRLEAALTDFERDPQALYARVTRDLGLTPEEWERFRSSLLPLEAQVLQRHLLNPRAMSKKELSERLHVIPRRTTRLILMVELKLMAFLRDEAGYFAKLRERKSVLPDYRLTAEQRQRLIAEHGLGDFEIAVLDRYALVRSRKNASPLADEFGKNFGQVRDAGFKLREQILHLKNNFDFGRARALALGRRGVEGAKARPTPPTASDTRIADFAEMRIWVAAFTEDEFDSLDPFCTNLQWRVFSKFRRYASAGGWRELEEAAGIDGETLRIFWKNSRPLRERFEGHRNKS